MTADSSISLAEVRKKVFVGSGRGGLRIECGWVNKLLGMWLWYITMYSILSIQTYTVCLLNFLQSTSNMSSQIGFFLCRQKTQNCIILDIFVLEIFFQSPSVFVYLFILFFCRVREGWDWEQCWVKVNFRKCSLIAWMLPSLINFWQA